MKTISELINENKNSRLKPIHLFKNDGQFDDDYCADIFAALEKEWPAALQDCHEDEYMYYIDTPNEYFDNDIYNTINNMKSINGIATRGIGCNYKRWSQVKDGNKSVFLLSQGNGGIGKDRLPTRHCIFADKSFFDKFNIQ